MAVEIRVPTLGESIVDAVVATWLKHEGDTVSQGEALVELETDKVNVEVPAEQGGVLQKIEKQEGEVVSVGDVLGMLGESAAPAAAASEPAPPTPATQETTLADVPRTPSGQLAALESHRPPSPLARRVAAEYNVDLSQVKGNSAHGRVTRDDVINYLERSRSGQLPELTPAPVQPATPAPARSIRQAKADRRAATRRRRTGW